ncbi:MAG: EscU/YscU/HrcU family type III secretion system export apparatus switch protein [Phycisphaerae bacterium]|nr:EscU/YscU/HrcU family type III secretion system export apparatus switch protein [Phycisphaerae bacterium]
MSRSMAKDNSADRTHPPTPFRLAEARRQGNVARSPDATATAAVIAGVGLLAWLGPALLDEVRQMTAVLLDGRGDPMAGPWSLGTAAWSAGAGILLPLAGIVGGVLLAVAATAFLQVGPLFAAESIKPKLSRINPAEGMRRIFSSRSLVRGGFAIARIAVVGFLAADYLRQRADMLPAFVGGDAAGIMAVAGGVIRPLVLRLAVALGAIALLDLLYQRWRHAADLKITYRQWKEDMKQAEGDPAVRAKRRRQANLAAQRISVTVPTATLVIAGTAGAAVALRYDQSMLAPRILAKGNGQDAADIVGLAESAGVPVVILDELAAELYRRCRRGQAVPANCYENVAAAMVSARKSKEARTNE